MLSKRRRSSTTACKQTTRTNVEVGAIHISRGPEGCKPFPLQKVGGPFRSLWLAYKEAKAMIKFDAALAAPTTPDRK